MAAANKEGALVLYTASLTEVVQETINVFNKSFPNISVNMVRASGGQLITRIRSEAAAGKLEADVIDHSDRGQSKSIENLFADYAPPNAADYMPETLVSPETVADHDAILVHRLEPGDHGQPAENLDGFVQAGLCRRQDRPGDRAVRRHHLDPHHVRASGAWVRTTGRSRPPRSRNCIRPARRYATP